MATRGDFRFLDRDTRRAMAGLLALKAPACVEMRRKRKPQPAAASRTHRCFACLGPVPAGELVCGRDCDDLWLRSARPGRRPARAAATPYLGSSASG